MKKFFAICAIFAVLMFVVSCGGKKKTADNGDTGETVTDEDTGDTEPSGDTEPTGDTEPADDADTDKPDTTPEPNDDDADTAVQDPCDQNPCAGIENATGCISHGDYYECDCIENYAWNWETYKCFDPCDPNPCKDIPDSDGKCSFNENKNDYNRYICGCFEHYQWGGMSCNPEERVVQCKGLPKNAEWSSGSEVTQIWDPAEEEYYPPVEGAYDENYCWGCCFKCKDGYFWSGSACVNPCSGNPCAAFDHAYSICNPVSFDNFICSCESGYFWNGKQLGCTDYRAAFGNICTGETKCYGYDFAYDNNIGCPAPGEDFFGQDTQYSGSGRCVTQYFEDGGDTVISPTFGLEWSRKISENTVSYDEAVEYCESFNALQNVGWRLPNTHELMTVLFDKSLDTYFPGRPLGSYWSSKNSDRVWRVSEDYEKSMDLLYSISDDDKAYALCVRGDEMSDFQDLAIWLVNGTNVYHDTLTDFMWTKDEVSNKNRRQALEYCENLIHAGYSDWRLPNRNELMSIVVPATRSGLLFYRTYWTSSYIETLNFNHRKLVSGADALYSYYALCVRSDICQEGFFWDGENCISDPCLTASCSIANSTGFCVPKTAETYECVCSEGYFWDGSACVNPCLKNGANPCSGDANSNGTCTAAGAGTFYCGCKSGYRWDGETCAASDSGSAQINKIYNICTGQTKCYNNSDEMTCPAEGEDFFGQDGQISHYCYKKTFTQGVNKNQKYIIDGNTELEWSGLSEKFYNRDDAKAYCETLDYAGKKDWRLPNMHEMQTISFDDQLFKNMFDAVEENTLWTVSSKTASPDTGWTVGRTSYDKTKISHEEPKTNTNRVLCVRGKQISNLSFRTVGTSPEEYIEMGNNINNPHWTKLSTEAKTWKDALAYCENLEYADSDAWHLPTINDLAAIINYNKSAPASDFPNLKADGKVWSSTSSSPYAAYYVDFSNGLVKDDNLKTSQKDVICIRYY